MGSTIGRASASSSTQLQLFTILSSSGTFLCLLFTTLQCFFFFFFLSPVGFDNNATFADNSRHQAFQKKIKKSLTWFLYLNGCFMIHFHRSIIWICSSALIRDFRYDNQCNGCWCVLTIMSVQGSYFVFRLPVCLLEVGLTFPSSSSTSCPNTLANI